MGLNDRGFINKVEDLKSQVSDALYVNHSTLNQAVNYIPLVKLGFKRGINITIKDSKNFQNKEWDKNLKNVIENTKLDFKFIDEIELAQKDVNNVRIFTNKLNAIFKNEKKIFWNLTGGQRPYIFAVMQFVEDNPDKENYIAYFDGNTGDLVVYENNFSKRVANVKITLKPEEFDIPIALELMGFSSKDLKSTEKLNEINLLDDKWKTIGKVYNEYIHKRDLRLLLINNKGNKEFLEEKLKDYSVNDFSFEKYHKNSPQKFGYLLEDFVTYAVVAELRENLLDLRTSLKVYHDEATGITDELDVVVLDKKGQLYVFECKSGAMTGDTAKSTNYTTYAINGVYGKPILITPLLQEDLDRYYFYDDKNIKTAVKSAQRAKLKVWGIDKVASNLERDL